jgi:hypothetical protein
VAAGDWGGVVFRGHASMKAQARPFGKLHYYLRSLGRDYNLWEVRGLTPRIAAPLAITEEVVIAARLSQVGVLRLAALFQRTRNWTYSSLA